MSTAKFETNKTTITLKPQLSAKRDVEEEKIPMLAEQVSSVASSNIVKQEPLTNGKNMELAIKAASIFSARESHPKKVKVGEKMLFKDRFADLAPSNIEP